MRRIAWGLILLLTMCASAWALPKSAVFYYGAHPPVRALKAFDYKIVEPNHASTKALIKSGKFSDLYAYISLGEVARDSVHAKAIRGDWKTHVNSAWGSDVIDQTNPDWQRYVIEGIIRPLWQQGYRGFFLDTLDAYHALPKDQQLNQQRALIKLINRIKQTYPEAKLILNRGFELLPDIHKLVTAVAAESLYGSWRQEIRRYGEVSPQGRKWLLTQLNEVKDQYHLPVIVIDYAPDGKRDLARQYAWDIERHGFIPYVGNKHLNNLGVSSIEVMPRDILVIYDSQDAESLLYSMAHRLFALPIEYLGYTPRFIDVRKPLPSYPLSGRVAGIIVYLSSADAGLQSGLYDWLMKQKTNGIYFALINHLGFPQENAYLKPLGMFKKQEKHPKRREITINYQDDDIGFEMNPVVNAYAYQPLRVEDGDTMLQLKGSDGTINDVIAITSWGGYALAPYVTIDITRKATRWILNPFTFIQKTLRLPTMPSPDTTTENGRRFLIVHIDGDGFPSFAEFTEDKVAGEVMLKEIIDHYRIPTTVSIIEAETAKHGLFPKISERLEKTAREIFKKDWVEIANHTYSHPFKWRKLAKNPSLSEAHPGKYNLPVKGYSYEPKREIIDSTTYINEHLAPKDKRCKILLWSGDAYPGKDALKLTYQIHLRNLNGGNTTVTRDTNTILDISPLGVWTDNYFQVLAPIQNENIYTNLWRGPFWGFQRVIETMQITDKPRRFKPMNIYFHFYSASKLSALNALKKVYDWTLAQHPLPIFASHFVDIAHDFENTLIAKLNYAWLIKNSGSLRELRLPKSNGYPDLKRSSNVIGFAPLGKDYLIHLGPSKTSYLRISRNKPTEPYIVYANGQVSYFARSKLNIAMRITSFLPLELTLANMQGCQLRENDKTLDGKTNNNGFIDYKLLEEGEHALTIQCR